MMSDYHNYNWEMSEAMPAELKQSIMYQIKRRQAFGKTGLLIFGGMLGLLLYLMSRTGGEKPDALSSTFLAAIGGLILIVFVFAFFCSGKIKEKFAADRFVWRMGTVTEVYMGTKYHAGHTVVDGQFMPYTTGLRVGEQVIVIGFDTADDSRTLATFHCFKINL